MQKLLGTTPETTQARHRPSLKVDRRYGGKQLLEDPSLAKFETGAICNKASRNLFLSSGQIDEKKCKWKVNKKLKEDIERHSGRSKFDYDFIGRCLEEVKDWVTDLRDRIGAHGISLVFDGYVSYET